MLNVATMAAEPGARVELTDVLLISNGGTITVGSPLVANALVVAEVVEHGKGKKVINFKYKAKVRYRRKRGHRQGYTQLAVTEIHLGNDVATAPRRERRAPATETPIVNPLAIDAPIAEPMPAGAVEVPEAAPETFPADPEAPAPTRRRRRTTPSSETSSSESSDTQE